MKKPLLYCFITVMITSGLAWPTAAADGVVTHQMSTMNLSAMPLVSKSLAEFSRDSSATEPGQNSNPIGYDSKREGPGWVFTSLMEPFYLSLFGAALLIFGTVRGRKDF